MNGAEPIEPEPDPTPIEPEPGITAASMGFAPVVRAEQSPLVAAAAAREEGAIKAMIMTAMARPRDEVDATERVLMACRRPGVAKAATWKIERGGKALRGPSVKLARLIAMYWGNVRSGIKLIEDTPTERHICGWAHDVQTNTYADSEHRFSKKIQRKNKKTGVTEWLATDDEREIREATARWGAICERNSLLKLIPPDVVDAALKVSQDTEVKAARGELEANREDAVRRLVYRFGQEAVTKDMLDRYLEHDVATVDERELADLQAILTALEEGQANREEYFPIKAASAKAGLDAIKEKAAAAEQKVSLPGAPKDEADDAPVTQPLLEAIGAAIAAGKAKQQDLSRFKLERGVGPRDRLNCGQAREFLHMVASGELARFEDDGISQARTR